jgi:hypothetical protein
MKYDIGKVPPTRAQISDQLRRSTEKSELLSLYQLVYWTTQVIVLAIFAAIVIFAESSILKGVLLGTTTLLWVMLFVMYSSFIEDKKFRYTHEIQIHHYIENSALETAVFESWGGRALEVQRYVSVVSDQGRSLTFGEYLAIKDRIQRLRDEAPDEPIMEMRPISDPYH